MNRDCLSERDLILLHYAETPEQTSAATAAAHLLVCPDCQARKARLAADLSRILPLAEPEPAATTRVAARVGERLSRRAARRWLPALGAAAAATAALVITFAVRSPQNNVVQVGPATPPSIVSMNLEEELPDADFLENLELIEELELLQQIEGV